VLGLTRLVDAGTTTVPDDGRSNAEMLPVDAKLCFVDTFPGPDVDIAVWDEQLHPGIVVSANANLVFRFLTSVQPGTAGIRTKGTFDLQNKAVVARLVTRPLSTNETALIVTNADTPLYTMRMTGGDEIIHLLVGANEIDVAQPADFWRIRFDGNDVLFGTSQNGITYAESSAGAQMPPTGTKIQITATSVATVSAVVDVTWDFVSVSCP